ncbi:MAG TPA: hypothetical protein VIU62_20065 [Chloroflexota bacterium]
MHLSPEETARFYRVWFALLHWVNEQRRLIAAFPATPPVASLTPADMAVVRDALWADDALRERFLATNPAGLTPADLTLVASWQHRLVGKFIVERYLKKHTIFLSEEGPARAYGVLGLVSPIEDVVGPFLPIYVQAVLLPFEGRIIYDGLVSFYSVTFGPGMRASFKSSYRDAQEREGIITTLPPAPTSGSSDGAASGVSAGNARVLAAFRKHLAKTGLGAVRLEQHVAVVRSFAEDYLFAQDPPRGLLDLNTTDVQAYLGQKGNAPHRISLKRFVQFLWATGRGDPNRLIDLTAYLKHPNV